MSKIEVDNIDTVTGTTELTIGGTNATSITLGSGASFSNVSGQNYPAFRATATQQSLSNGTWTKIQFDTEEYDTDSAYDSATNYRFTIPSGKGGKYFVKGSLSVDLADQKYANIRIYKNGSAVDTSLVLQSVSSSVTLVGSIVTTTVITLADGDYIECFGRQDTGSSTNTNIAYMEFLAFRIGA